MPLFVERLPPAPEHAKWTGTGAVTGAAPALFHWLRAVLILHRFLFLKLQIVKLLIQAFPLDQFKVLAFLHDAALVLDHDAVRTHGGKAVGDDEGGAAGTKPCMAPWIRRSDSLSRAEVASSQDAQPRVGEDGPGDGDPLALAAGKLDAPLAHHVRVALRQA